MTMNKTQLRSVERALTDAISRPNPNVESRYDPEVARQMEDDEIVASRNAPEVQQMIQMAANLSRLIGERDRLMQELAIYKESAATLEAANENLKKECRRLRDSRDHYMQALSGAEADIESIGKLAAKAITHARAHVVGERPTPRPNAPQDYAPKSSYAEFEREVLPQPDEHAQIPQFLRAGPRDVRG
jgi:chromosome segregation ATPase